MGGQNKLGGGGWIFLKYNKQGGQNKWRGGEISQISLITKRVSNISIN